MELWSDDVLLIASACSRWAGRFFRNPVPGTERWQEGDDRRLLVISGQTGCGKTMAMRGLSRFVSAARVPAAERGYWAWPPNVWWCNWPPTAKSIQDRVVSTCAAIRDAVEADVLFLDDIGAESDKYRSGEATDALCQLLSRRENLWTVVTTNIARESWAEKFDVRVSDRLQRRSQVVEVKCGSYSLRER